MKIRRREFMEAVGGSILSASTAVEGDALTNQGTVPQADRQMVSPRGKYTITGGRIAVNISGQGNIVGVNLGSGKAYYPLAGHTYLAQCELNGQMTSSILPNGGVEFRKPLSFRRGYRSATLVERFQPTGTSVRWELEIHGEREPWATAVETHLTWPAAKSARFWTAWGDDFSAPITESLDSSGRSWTDPTIPQPFRNMQLFYGGFFDCGTGFSVPIATIIDVPGDSGMSLALSPEDNLVDVRLITDPEGSITLSRLDNKIDTGEPARFAMDLFAHEGDWRPALGWMTKRYPDYFEPANPAVYDAAGCGAYSAHTGELDGEKFKKMAFRVNWLASFDWPYLGMYLPPVPEGSEWLSWYGKPASTRKMDDYCRRMQQMGFFVLCYFNVTEFGAKINFPPPATAQVSTADSWKDPNAFLYQRLGSGILYGEDGKPIPSWEGAVAMDPADPAFQTFLLDQVARYIKEIPHCSGICIDRMDWLTRFNYRAEDGVTWVDAGVGAVYGRPVRALSSSWKHTLSRIGPMMHQAGKVIYGNTQVKRLDLMREVDGIFDEFGYFGFNLNQDSFIGALKPVLAWTSDKMQLQPNPDEYFQRHLFLGAFPMVPYPEADHSILPDEWAERFYTDYGPLLNELRGRRWVLKAHVIEVEHSTAKANIFETPGGFVVPVTFGGKATTATVAVRGLAPVDHPENYQMEAILPGSSEWKRVKYRTVSNSLAITIPLSRGCAMLRLAENKERPAQRPPAITCEHVAHHDVPRFLD